MTQLWINRHAVYNVIISTIYRVGNTVFHLPIDMQWHATGNTYTHICYIHTYIYIYIYNTSIYMLQWLGNATYINTLHRHTQALICAEAARTIYKANWPSLTMLLLKSCNCTERESFNAGIRSLGILANSQHIYQRLQSDCGLNERKWLTQNLGLEIQCILSKLWLHEPLYSIPIQLCCHWWRIQDVHA